MVRIFVFVRMAEFAQANQVVFLNIRLVPVYVMCVGEGWVHA